MRGFSVVRAGVCALSVLLGARGAWGQEIFWTDTLRNEIWTSLFDGSNARAIVTEQPAMPEAIAVDPIEGKVYWTLDGNVDQIRRANFDGTGVETVLDDMDGPNVIAIDVVGRKMYFGAEDSQSIRRANLDGSGIQFLTNFIGEDTEIDAIGLDVAGGHVYWAQDSSSDVYRANLDGTGAALYLDGPTPTTGFGNIESIFVDPVTNTLYLNDEDDTEVRTQQLPSGAVLSFGLSEALHPRDMAIDVIGRKLYWTQEGGIFRSELDGSDVQPVVSGLTEALGAFPLGIAVVPEPSMGMVVLIGVGMMAARRRRGR